MSKLCKHYYYFERLRASMCLAYINGIIEPTGSEEGMCRKKRCRLGKRPCDEYEPGSYKVEYK